MEIESNNSIARLYKLISNLKEETTSNPKVAFCNVFSLTEDSDSEIMLAYSDLIKLCIDSNNLIEKYHQNNTILKNNIDNTIFALSQVDFNDTTFGMRNFKNSLKDTTLSGLQILSITIPSCEEILSNEQLDEIYDSINSILIDIDNSNINNDLKVILSDRINDILIIIRKYKIYGSTELIKVLETSIGSICVNQNNIQTEPEKSLCKNIISKLVTTISFLNKNVPLIETLGKFIS